MELNLNGKAAIVTGGSVGIGKAVAKELALEGVDVAICARREDLLTQAANDLASETGRKIIPIVTDTTSQASVASMVERAAGELGGIDILVNNAATPGGLVLGPLAESAEEDLLADINTKVVGYFRCAKAAAPLMQERGWGRIINIGGLSARSAGAISGLRNAGLVHFTKTLSGQLGPDGVTVNLVHPGSTRTERTTDEDVERASRATATRRMVDASEIGYVVAFLASDKATAITGEVIAAGGGVGVAVYQ
ncbi:MAG: SDR family oxidoreductase [SAR202 cluster bacterium]|jgi:NAD(P)-dependent dehydrogenase (short-subunit alcohol dehydrogenase family)|nr:short-chain dehydrogenase [Chloroflexota bacterium]MDP6420175.1 SDR family oxidoreductase [SAR202 cluster bacterium]HAL47744.1 short-chain dehydrogenase [Dehalococcoidia bacterium]MDP6664667.1 SDR family oxidoreductase [SAR202 cluster bacterium]MDP6800856.1 SDR family oxidoreductase [SAR202 cluster bacterium]|tara:strand:+ start:1226 stop:1978 length:753 start_codon:yes stop_codon:yes gene_type:complete